MSGFRTSLACLALLITLTLQAPPARALAPDEAQLRGFATCAGRLSALMEHQWMFDGAGSERTQAERAMVIDLLDAVMPKGRGREVLAWRIDAKQAHSALLTRATFAERPKDRLWAQRTADRLVAECRAILLS